MKTFLMPLLSLFTFALMPVLSTSVRAEETDQPAPKEVSVPLTRLAPALPKAPKAIVLIYADDLGYGDTGAYGAKRIPTPNIDKLANEGLRFTQAYCTSATCTPSRYAMMMGQYPWRKKGTGVLPGDANMILPPASEQASLASVMQRAGYKTMAVGKWHLGLGKGKVDWNKPITFGPKEVGYDESFIIAATGDRVPCVYVKNGAVYNLDPNDPIEVSYKQNFPGQPTGRDNPELLRWKHSHGHDMTIINGIGRIGYMRGGKSALWKDQDMADVLTDQAVEFIKNNKDTPFFLYFGANDIHVPRDPNERYLGKSECGVRGDATVQLDDSVRRIREALEKNGLADDALILFSSDNGPVLDDGYIDEAREKNGDHKPAGPLRGGKYSLLEGGTRIPFIAWWPGKVPVGTTEAVISQMDFAPSLAALTQTKLKDGEFPDAENHITTLFDPKDKGRSEIVIHGVGNNLALRQGTLKYYTPGSVQRTALSGNENASEKVGDKGALYDVVKDPAEKNNLVEELPDVAERMATRLAEIAKGLAK